MNYFKLSQEVDGVQFYHNLLSRHMFISQHKHINKMAKRD